MPPAVSLDALSAPVGYIADEGVRAAVNVALALGQPLLVTGDPGTGKTQLAHSIAFELDLPLLVFNTKTTSSARDLFYRYDALRHFQDAQIRLDEGANAEPSRTWTTRRSASRSSWRRSLERWPTSA